SSMTNLAKNDARDWRALYPFASHWLGLTAGGVDYLDESPAGAGGGGAPAPVFLPRQPNLSFPLPDLLSAPPARYRCVAVDHIGCGLSDKPQRLFTLNDHITNLRSLVERLDLKRITLVAQDWGGAIGLGAMEQMPERLERIVLFNTGAFPPRYMPWR